MEEGNTIETGLFEHRKVKPHLINPCCFGEDFVVWLKARLSPLQNSGFRCSEAIQEDYGWGFWVERGKDPFWVALSYVGYGPQESPARWMIFVNYDPGLNLLKRLFHKPNLDALKQLRDAVRWAIASESAIKILPAPEYGS